MVEIDASGISRKLKMKKTEKLIKEIFEDSFDIRSSPLAILSVRKEDSSEDFLIIGLKENNFTLFDRQYFDRVYDLAQKYEELFGTEKTDEKGGEVDFRIRYYKPST